MGFGYRYKPSKTQIREYAEKMDRIDDFCRGKQYIKISKQRFLLF